MTQHNLGMRMWLLPFTNTATLDIHCGGTYLPLCISLLKRTMEMIAFARQLCDDARLPGWLSAFPVHSQTFKPAQASFAHTNSQPSHSTSYKIFLVFFFFFKCWRISSKFSPATWKCRQTTTQSHRPHQRDMPPLLIPVAAIGKCTQNFMSQQIKFQGMPGRLERCQSKTGCSMPCMNTQQTTSPLKR